MINNQGDEKQGQVDDRVAESIHCGAWFWLKHEQTRPNNETSTQRKRRDEIDQAAHSGEEWEDAYDYQH